MIRWLKEFFDVKLGKFVIVGVINTVIGTLMMLGLYNLAGWSYWASSATNYILTSILSFVLNKHFTFQYQGNVLKSACRFAINIVICYIIAYGIAKPATYYCFAGASTVLRENLAMLVGMCLFTVLNYIGQRFFAFK